MNNQMLEVRYQGKDLNVSLNLKQKSSKWVVCLHGIQSNKNLFDDLFNQSFLDDYSLLAVDFIGFGDSDKPEDFSYDLQDQANIVKQVIEQLDIDNIYLVGHSLGGMVGTLLLKSLQTRIKGFINTEGNLVYADCGLSKEVAEFSYEEFKKKYPHIKNKIKDSAEPSSQVRSQSLEKIPDYAFYKTSLSIVEWAKSESLLKIFRQSTVKKMFLYGDKNPEKVGIIPDDIQKVKVPNSGHFMLIDNPKSCYEAIKDSILT